jgi:hypothetical protein
MIIALWPLSGMLGWVFLIWYWKIDVLGSDWSWWLFLFNACVVGPFMWLFPIFTSREL